MFDENTPGTKEELFAWLRHMNKHKGSDLFITTNFPPAMKVDGKITRLSDEPLSHQPARYQPLPCQYHGSTRCSCIGVPLHYQQYT